MCKAAATCSMNLIELNHNETRSLSTVSDVFNSLLSVYFGDCPEDRKFISTMVITSRREEFNTMQDGKEFK